MRSLTLSVFLLSLVFKVLAVPQLKAQEAPAINIPFEKSASSPNADAAKARMKQNLPAVDALKKLEKIGETYNGYLLNRQPLSETEDKLIRAENSDRKVVYEYLAHRANSTAEKIAVTRARQIRERSVAGMWFVDAQGRWSQKT